MRNKILRKRKREKIMYRLRERIVNYSKRRGIRKVKNKGR